MSTMPLPRLPRPFDLPGWFAVLGLLCILLSALGTGFFLSRFLTSHMLERDAAVSAEFVESIVRAERSWPWFEAPETAAARGPLDSFFNHISQVPGVVRSNVFAADGTVLWSSDPALIGRRFADNPELDRALAGEIVVEHGSVDDTAKAEHVRLDAATGGSRFMEAYLPVWDAEHRRVIGVVEIYRLPLALFRAIDEGTQLVWLSAAASGALLFGALSWIALRARCTIVTQQARLLEAEALATVGAVASAVAHGVRNPLASIRSSAEIALIEDEDGRLREPLTDILREADRMEGWVRDLLLTARGEGVAPGAVDIARLLRETARSFAPAAERQGVRLTLEAEELPPARGNTGPLSQALDNLVANAIEAMPAGGELRLAARLAASGREVEIRVADTGEGLPEPIAAGTARIFFSTKPRGTGLGLALARRIVARYAGSLGLEPAPGGGTVATIRLPLAA